MAENPFQQYGNINESGMMNEYRAMKMMNMADRMGPQPGRSHFAGGRGGLGQNPLLSSMLGGDMAEPDYSGFTYDPAAHAAASKFLGQYGLSPLEPSQVNPNAFLPNTGFFGRHPKLAAGLEGATFGAAATKGADTWGEGISNVAGGMLEGRAARQGMINRQFARPFNEGRMLEGLEDLAQKRELQSMDIEHLRHVNQHLDDAVPRQYTSTGIPAMGQVATTDVGSGDVRFTPIPQTNLPPPKPHVGGAGSTFDQVLNARNQERAARGLKPLGSAGMLALNAEISGAQTGARELASLTAQFKSGAKIPVDVKNQLDNTKKLFIDPKNKEMRDSIRKSLIGDPNYKGAYFGPEVENAIDSEINRRNQQTFQTGTDILDQWQQQMTQGEGASLTPSQPQVKNYNQATGRLE